MGKNNRYYPLNMFRVCVNGSGSQWRGTAISPLSGRDIMFSDITELIVAMDKLFDEKGYPQSFQCKRSFLKGQEESNFYQGIPNAERTAEEILSRRGETGTCDIMVRSRRNTSWQGEVYNAEGEEIGSFDGDVELLDLLTR